jgi:hypothetical protein
MKLSDFIADLASMLRLFFKFLIKIFNYIVLPFIILFPIIALTLDAAGNLDEFPLLAWIFIYILIFWKITIPILFLFAGIGLYNITMLLDKKLNDKRSYRKRGSRNKKSE